MSDQTPAVLTGENLEKFRLVMLHRSLRLQARTGIKACRISAVACAQRLGYTGRTAKALQADMEKKHPELTGVIWAPQ